jgi:hypothetical protein
MSEAGTGENQTVSSVENQQVKLSRWLESGVNQNAVAAYGGDIGVLKTILSTGSVPSFTTDELLPYQREMLNKGGHLYYFTPIYDRIREARPELASNIASRVPDPEWFLSNDRVKNTARGYALSQSVKNIFFERTGRKVNAEDVYALAMDIIPDKFDSFLEATRDYQAITEKEEIIEETDPAVLNSLRSEIDASLLNETLVSCLQRRGVIIYFNQSIFAGNNNVSPGEENELEFMVVSPQQLTADTIAGIEILSDADKTALNLQ